MSVRFERTAQVALITVDRPAKLNAMDTAVYAELDQAFSELDTDSALEVGIVTGAGDRSFSSGADLQEMHGPDAEPRGWGPWRPDEWGFGRMTRKPLIAAINGYALAGGLELALTCDIRIATHNATFGAPEVKWALLHGLGATRLPAAVGLSNAMSLLLTGESIDSQEALRIGLITRIVASEELLPEAHRIAEQITGNNATAVQMTKELALRAALSGSDGNMRLYKSYFGYLENLAEQKVATASFVSRERRMSER